VTRILVVDDEEADRFVLRTILERSGHEVLEASDGAEALEKLRGIGVEVVITDLQMRNVHGLELITVLRDLDPRPGIIAVSGTGEIQLDMADAVGADRTLTKPIMADQLLAALDSLVGGGTAGPETRHPA
jgi:two-component system chemotaxis response regulator CheY